MNWAAAWFRGNDSYLYSHTWKCGLTEARNQSFPWPDFPTPFFYKWSRFAWLTWNKDNRVLFLFVTQIFFFSQLFIILLERMPAIHIYELPSAHIAFHILRDNFISTHANLGVTKLYSNTKEKSTLCYLLMLP